MRILIYGIGGEYNGRLVGTAFDPSTGLNLLRLLRLTRSYACSLHGYGLDPVYDTSGELLLDAAASMFIAALDRHADAVLATVDPPDEE